MTEEPVTYEQLGWRDFFEAQTSEEDKAMVRGRVIRQDLNRYHLLTPDGIAYAVLRSRARNDAMSKAELPTVGDWVLCSETNPGDSENLVIERTLERFSKFSRKEAGERHEEQVVAANIDTVFIVTGLDDNFNTGRIERYLLLAWNSGANPVIILSKADVCTDIEEKLKLLRPVAMGTPIHIVSALDGTGMEALRQHASPGATVALLGSSGVGKSTIINALLGYERFKTGEVREGDSKGRHTTTFRELCLLDEGGMLIDTPGMREIQIWFDEDGLASSFQDVESLAASCRFNDCSHDTEPGCAVREAIEDGRLDADRFASYRKFQQELEYFMVKQDAKARIDKKDERRRFTKLIRNRPNKRDS